MIYNLDQTEIENKREHLIKWLNLSKFRNKKAGELSGGFRRLLNIACSLCHNPKIIFTEKKYSFVIYYFLKLRTN
jgi:ABC-2 type transport system ATP-binding protein